MSTTANLLAAASLLTLPGILTAQDQLVDIGLYEAEHGRVEIRATPHSDFDGILSALVFTLRWDKTSDASLGRPLQNDAEGNYIPLSKSGEVQEEADHMYQVFSGIGLQTIGAAGLHWSSGKQYVLASIPVEGRANIELVNDAWTDDIHHNGSYYVSLNGVDRTGVIERSMAAGGEGAFELSVLPNPNNGHFVLTVKAPEESDLRYELTSSGGHIVQQRTIKGVDGIFRQDFDISSMSNGVYYLKLIQNDRIIVRKVMFQ